MTFHLVLESNILLKDSPEATDQDEILKRKGEEQQKRDATEAVDVEIEEYVGEEPVKNTLRNQFNFSERASQTFNPVLRERGISTEPPPTTGFVDTVTQWSIFDRYMQDIEKEKEKGKAETKQADDPDKKKQTDDPD